MHPRFYGDSYDIVRRSILGCLSDFGTWAVHPMFSEEFGQLFPRNYSQSLGLPLTTYRPVPSPTRRSDYFRETTSCPATDHLFLDPDTGLGMPPSAPTRRHLMGPELVEIVKRRAKGMVLVFDQSINRGQFEKGKPAMEETAKQLRKKLRYLKGNKVHAFAYCSQANFILVSTQEWGLQNAKLQLQRCLMIPDSRFIRAPN